MPAYQTPGVYVEEIPKLPPSVAEVSTAVPAFLGYTEKRPKGPDASKPVVARLSTLLEYTDIFGGPCNATFTVTTDANGALLDVKNNTTTKFLLYHAISHYFKNGGGPCYVVSVGTYVSADAPKKDHFSNGLGLLEQEDEPTLLVLTDAVKLAEADYYELCDAALSQCHKLGDRFAIFDVPLTGDVLPKDNKEATEAVKTFRNGIGMNYLAYGAAYHPYLHTSLSHAYEDDGVTISPPLPWSAELETDAVKVSYSGTSQSPTVEVKQATEKATLAFSVVDGALTITLPADAQKKPEEVTGDMLIAVWKAWKGDNSPKGFDITRAGAGTGKLTTTGTTATPLFLHWSKELAEKAIKVTYAGVAGAAPTVMIVHDETVATPTFSASDRVLTITIKDARVTGTVVVSAWKPEDTPGFVVEKTGGGSGALPARTTPLKQKNTLESIKTTDTALYNRIKARLAAERVILPPSAAVAGIYASVDRDRGVWKAPANVSVSAVLGPVIRITNEDQESLNVDQVGKSINAIRAFNGKGTLVWGARTLDGNNNEWRYIPVRRLFIMIEESARKATSFAVFEPNDATTWLKVKGMIESYLYGLWERGALAGSKPDAAYYVSVGLGKTMTTTDILEGRMIVEIGIAAVRPAEFIVLRFSHKLQQA